MLTRVFGGAQKKAPEMPPPAAPRETPPRRMSGWRRPRTWPKRRLRISPATSCARHPWRRRCMPTGLSWTPITDSLATAMAEAKRIMTSAAPFRAPRRRRRTTSFPKRYYHPTPETRIFGAPPAAVFRFRPRMVRRAIRSPASRRPPRRPGRSPFAEPPELPRGHSGDIFAESGQSMRQTHQRDFRLRGPETRRDAPPAMPARTPPLPARSPRC